MSSERREYFRVEDKVALDYRIVSGAEVDTLRKKIMTNTAGRFTTASDFDTISHQIGHAMHTVKAETPEVARVLDALDKKLNTLAQMMVSEEIKLDDYVAREANVSAGGIAFRSEHEIQAGDLLETRIVLLPAMIGILTISRVVYCERVEDENRKLPWQVAINHEVFRESDRELMVRHVMGKETERLRKRRHLVSDIN
ncbi:MAG: PilZ domain-containing protein [Gammaproteobacteria bacterium]